MCNVCGCGQGQVHTEESANVLAGNESLPEQGHVHPDNHHHHHAHHHVHHHPNASAEYSHHYGHGEAGVHVPGLSQSRIIRIEQDILASNNQYADANRRYLQQQSILALNLVSSPGSGKTELLSRTIRDLSPQLDMAVIEGDQQTSNDAQRIRETGVRAIQINTGKGCHLDAHMVAHALQSLQAPAGSVLFIENVGNLVCPAAFDLGEAHKVVILSVTEGEDKPVKYPDMFAEADIMLLNKVDLLPYLNFDVDSCLDYAYQVNPRLKVLPLSVQSGEGMAAWYQWLQATHQTTLAGSRQPAQTL